MASLSFGIVEMKDHRSKIEEAGFLAGKVVCAELKVGRNNIKGWKHVQIY